MVLLVTLLQAIESRFLLTDQDDLSDDIQTYQLQQAELKKDPLMNVSLTNIVRQIQSMYDGCRIALLSYFETTFQIPLKHDAASTTSTRARASEILSFYTNFSVDMFLKNEKTPIETRRRASLELSMASTAYHKLLYSVINLFIINKIPIPLVMMDEWISYWHLLFQMEQDRKYNIRDVLDCFDCRDINEALDQSILLLPNIFANLMLSSSSSSTSSLSGNKEEEEEEDHCIKSFQMLFWRLCELVVCFVDESAWAPTCVTRIYMCNTTFVNFLYAVFSTKLAPEWGSIQTTLYDTIRSKERELKKITNLVTRKTGFGFIKLDQECTCSSSCSSSSFCGIPWFTQTLVAMCALPFSIENLIGIVNRNNTVVLKYLEWVLSVPTLASFYYPVMCSVEFNNFNNNATKDFLSLRHLHESYPHIIVLLTMQMIKKTRGEKSNISLIKMDCHWASIANQQCAFLRFPYELFYGSCLPRCMLVQDECHCPENSKDFYADAKHHWQNILYRWWLSFVQVSHIQKLVSCLLKSKNEIGIRRHRRRHASKTRRMLFGVSVSLLLQNIKVKIAYELQTFPPPRGFPQFTTSIENWVEEMKTFWSVDKCEYEKKM